MRARNHRHHRSGFTLLELLVVAMLGTLVITMTANVWRWYGRSIKSMQVSAQLDKELKMAAQAIAADYGPALAVRTTDGSDLQFDCDTDSNSSAQWTTPDTVIEYTISGGMLIRRDLSTGIEIPMARNISALSAELVGGQLNIHLTATYRTTDQDLTLQLRDP
jgi:prepilin-type N-terminal cleavage/methylation domain-containing protein